MTRFIALIMSAAFLLGGCSSTKNSTSESDDTSKVSLASAENRYKKAHALMLKERFQLALREYNELIIQYPFGQSTIQAKLDSLFIFYKLGEADKAKKVANDFIEQYPRHENIDYAYYMKGLILFPKKKGLLTSYLLGSNALRNVTGLMEARAAFTDFVNKFPQSEQTPDAKQRLIFLDNALAQDELYVAEFYLAKKAYVAVINRCQYIVENYAKTPAARKALTLMHETYTKMGLTELAQNTQEVIDANYDAASQLEEKEKAKKGFSFPSLKMPNWFKKKDKAEPEEANSST